MKDWGTPYLPLELWYGHIGRREPPVRLRLVCHDRSVSVCYVAVRTIVPSRHGRYRATLWIFWGLAGWKLRLCPLRFFYVQLKVSQMSHLIHVVL